MGKGNALNRALVNNWNRPSAPRAAPVSTKQATSPPTAESIVTTARPDQYGATNGTKPGICFRQTPSPHPPATPTQRGRASTATPSSSPRAAPVTIPNTTGSRAKRQSDDDPADKRKKASTARKPFTVTTPTARLSDLGGVESCIEDVLEQIAMPLLHPEIYLHTGVEPPRGILLHGPPGCGKTLMANAIAGELGVPFLQISAPSVVSGMSGESEKKIRDVFTEAKQQAPCLLFIDEIDAITPKRETAQREMERRIVAQLLTCIDDLSWSNTDNKPVLIIGATNRADALDPALRRAGRFDREISMTVPDEQGRESILRVLCAKLRVAGDFDFHTLAKKTPGYVGADLNALMSAAGMIAVRRIFELLKKRAVTASLHAAAANSLPEEMPDPLPSSPLSPPALGLPSLTALTIPAPDPAMDDMQVDDGREPIAAEDVSLDTAVPLFDKQSPMEKLRSISAFLQAHPDPLTAEELEPLAITQEDFIQALAKVQPSSKREGFATVPDVSWDDIGALSHIREELRMAVVEPIRHPEYFARVGITAPAGVLLWGPPGCGKTLLAKAVANESHTNFISVKGPELLNKYVGESERAVRQVFARAKASSPCVVFFDELDALCGRRDESQSEASARVVNTLLTELDGMENRKQVFIIAATNRPDMIDPAMLRPGRLDKRLYVELPTAPERLEILRTLTRRMPLHPTNVSLSEIAHHAVCEGLSGADLQSLVREAAVAALRETVYASGQPWPTMNANGPAPAIAIAQRHFETAFTKVTPSVSKQDRASYDKLRRKFEI